MVFIVRLVWMNFWRILYFCQIAFVFVHRQLMKKVIEDRIQGWIACLSQAVESPWPLCSATRYLWIDAEAMQSPMPAGIRSASGDSEDLSGGRMDAQPGPMKRAQDGPALMQMPLRKPCYQAAVFISLRWKMTRKGARCSRMTAAASVLAWRPKVRGGQDWLACRRTFKTARAVSTVRPST
jgi:hypothetical protein